jgi:uncharacterized membrane protein YgcG
MSVGSDWPATRWSLTAPESFVLLNGPNASGGQAFKLGLTELVARGALLLETTTSGGIRHREVAMLRDGSKPGAPRERTLDAIWSIYQRTQTHTYGDGLSGVRIEDLAKAAARFYGSLSAYVKQDVLPALEDRGLYGRQDGRILWIFPTTRWVLTPEGTAAREELQRLLTLAEQRFGEWADTEPPRALEYASLAGAALLLQPELFSELHRARLTTGVQDTGAGVYVDPGVGAGEFDWGALGIGALGDASFDAFDAALGAIDSAIDSVAGSDGGSFDGGSSDGGGGGSDGGGGGGGGE